MADNEQKKPDTNNAITNVFTKGMLKDFNESYIGEGMWTHARNAINSSHDGQIGVIGNEPSNIHCITLPFFLIGCIHLSDDQWAVFTTDNNQSEIGIFDESACSYTKVVNDPCLNFKTTNLITGAYRRRFDCERVIYWDDGLNPTRTMNIDDVPFIINTQIVNDCALETPTTVLDCEALKIAGLIKYPCLNLIKGSSAGTLKNGSYQVCLAYTIDRVVVTDYIGLSEVQSIFSHENASGSLEIEIKDIDTSFDEFELILIFNVNQKTVASKVGYYSTNQGKIFIDRVDVEAGNIAMQDIILRSQSIDKSDAMYVVNDYLLRVGTYSKYKFNYQSFANKIETNWVATKYPADYYHKGGNNTGYMRDEVYSFFIRWIYNTGDRSESYHIPGRKATPIETSIAGGDDAFENRDGVQVEKWQVENTGSILTSSSELLDDQGLVVAKGKMAYWESTEKYPDNLPDIWGDLCGKNIRHHKFPDETVDDALSIYDSEDDTIILMGVQFKNIEHPVDQNGNPIESIVGYEILRGSREGNRSIIGKGLLNNMREYNIPGNNQIKGLYQNYPFNDLRPDDYLTSKAQLGNNAGNNNSKLNVYKKDYFSFHSPEVTFNTPYFTSNELKVYQEVYGKSRGYFTTPFKHPKFKIAGDGVTIISSIMAAIVGLASIIGTAAGADSTLMLQGTNDIGLTSDLLGRKRQDLSYGYLLPGTATGGGAWSTNALAVAPGPNVTGASAVTSRRVANALITTVNTVIITAMAPFQFKAQQQQLFSIIYGFIPKRQYSAQYNSYGFYDKFLANPEGNRRKKLVDVKYISNTIQGFSSEYAINNLNRSSVVVLQTETELTDPTTKDNSRFTLSKTAFQLNTSTESDISSYYGALKIPVPSQYGQLESIKQLSISFCIQYTQPILKFKYTSPVLFGGDVYINRFTEKNSMFFFNNWLLGEPDLTEIDYSLYMNVPYPRFWVNTNEQHSEFINNAKKYYSLDGLDKRTFYINRGFFYLFNSGVRDFYVESEINTAFRDWDIEPSKRHYDPYRYTDLNMLFRSDIIKSGNFYKYDYSLSISKLYNNFISWGNILPRDYNPEVAATCFIYRPNRVIYSLQQDDSAREDNWSSFLSFNYKDFTSPITSIKSVNKTGALFIMERESPLQFMGVDQLQTEQNLKVTIGDGGLFNQALQNIVNVDKAYEYGSCQSKYATVSTNHGIFWVSQNQGKVFKYAGQLEEISDVGMRWWFAKYLPSEILKLFPEYKYTNNALIGVGVQMIYDNIYEIVYISKKDYKPIIDLKYDVDVNEFYTDDTGVRIVYPLGSPVAFEDASWTISYDPKNKMWISFHDWIPTFLIPSKTHFMSVKNDSVWKHNSTCTSYCKYYGENYPWEVEFVSSTGQQISTLRNLEYQLEAYNYFDNCKDKFHVLDENFDDGIVYNSEQISGLLNFNIKPKNDPVGLLNFPKVTPNYIDILYTKEENKYRFNQFWDVTRDRLEFNKTQFPVPMFNTDATGYKFEINPLYIDYNKSPLQRKKFRHYFNKVFLRKRVSGDIKFLFKLSNQKIQPSYR
jgi:hypothetical protein